MNVPSSTTQSLSSTNCVTSSRPMAPSYRPTYSGCVSRDDALAEHRGRQRNLRALGQRHDFVLQAEAMDLDAGDDHRLCTGSDDPGRFVGRFAQGHGIADRGHVAEFVRRVGHDLDHVARNFDEHRTLEARRRVEHPIDLAKGNRRIDQFRGRHADLLEDFQLRAEITHFVVQQRIVVPLAHARQHRRSRPRAISRRRPRQSNCTGSTRPRNT